MSLEINSKIQLTQYFGSSNSVTIANIPNIANVKQIYKLVDGNYRAWNQDGSKAFPTIDYGEGYLIVSEDSAPSSYVLIDDTESLPSTIEINASINIVRYVGPTVDLSDPENITNFKQIYKLVDGNYRAWNKDGSKAFPTLDDGETYLILSENVSFPYLFSSISDPDYLLRPSPNGIEKINLRSFSVESIIDILSGVDEYAFSLYPERGKAYVASSVDGTGISVIDLDTSKLICHILTPAAIKNINRYGDRLYATSESYHIYEIDLNTNRIVHTIALSPTTIDITSAFQDADFLYALDRTGDKVYVLAEEEEEVADPPPEPPVPTTTTTIAPGYYCIGPAEHIPFPYPCLTKTYRQTCNEDVPEFPYVEIYTLDSHVHRMELVVDTYEYGDSLLIESISETGDITTLVNTGEFDGSDLSSFDSCQEIFGNKARYYEFYKPEGIRHLRITITSNDPKNMTGRLTGLSYKLCYPCYGIQCPVGYSLSQISCECIEDLTTIQPTPPPDPPVTDCLQPVTIKGYAYYKGNAADGTTPQLIPETNVSLLPASYGGHCCIRGVFTPKLFFDDGTCLYANKTIDISNVDDPRCGSREDSFFFYIPDGLKINDNTQMMLECVSSYVPSDPKSGVYLPDCEIFPIDTSRCHSGVTWVVLTAEDISTNQQKIIFSDSVVPNTLDGIGFVCGTTVPPTNLINWTQVGADIDGEAASDWSGRSVALSSDGSRVAIGAPYNNVAGTDAGHVRVYDYDIVSSTWTQVGADIDGEAAGDWSGYSVAMSSDGSRVAIGANQNNGTGPSAGHVRVYDLVGSTWTQVGADIDGEAAGDLSGYSVAMSSDGSRVAIGAYGNDGTGTDAGHVRVYDYDIVSSTWTQVGADIDGEAANDESGYSVSLSSDGSRVAIGAYFNDGTGTDAGHVRVYDYDIVSSTWTQVGADIDGEADGDWSGWSVAMSSDGNTVAIGSPLNDGKGTYSGHVRVYSWDGGAWTQVGADIDGEAAGDRSGYSVAMSSDGSRVAIGADDNDGKGTYSGHVRVYSWDGGAWTQVGADIDGEAAGDRSGYSVAMSSDGSRVAIGANQNDGTGVDAGHVRVWATHTTLTN
jgi:hypothetical protein